ncbi:MAG: PEP-CTERM sorting domain-containing protein [Planctomycetota bacterium]
MSSSISYGQFHVIGWQTFENAGGDNNSGIADDTPDTNSTFDSTPVGSNNGGLYLTGSIGPNASALGWDGLGQATNNNFLNGPTFGNDLTITDYTLADGSAGTRIGPFGGSGTSSWKFSGQNSANQLLGDFSITNESDYAFRLERIHFDARGLAAATSPSELTVNYLAGPGELINVSTGTEVSDGRTFYNNTWSSTGVENVSQSIAAVINSGARIAPGQSAAFRFIWSGNTGNGQAQIDNIAFSGSFQDQNNGFALIDPRAVPEPGTFGMIMIGLLGLLRTRRS